MGSALSRVGGAFGAGFMAGTADATKAFPVTCASLERIVGGRGDLLPPPIFLVGQRCHYGGVTVTSTCAQWATTRLAAVEPTAPVRVPGGSFPIVRTSSPGGVYG